MKQLIQKIQSINQKTSFLQEDMPEIANQILQSLGNKNKAPVPIVKIVTSVGFQLVSGELEENVLAIISIDEDLKRKFKSNKVIAINNLDTLNHQRFIIAHELAHYLFDFNVSNSITYYNTYDTKHIDDNLVEQRANSFARNLLMPEYIFKKQFKKNIVKNNLYATVEKLANIFQVPMDAVLYRINELHLIKRNN